MVIGGECCCRHEAAQKASSAVLFKQAISIQCRHAFSEIFYSRSSPLEPEQAFRNRTGAGVCTLGYVISDQLKHVRLVGGRIGGRTAGKPINVATNIRSDESKAGTKLVCRGEMCAELVLSKA